MVPFYSSFCQGRFPKPDFRPDPPINGYIITINNDTIKCDFKKPSFGALKYKPANSTGKFKKPSIDEIKEYYSTFDSTVYVAMAADSDSYLQFLKRLESGAIKLYEKQETQPATYMNGMWVGGGTTTYFYISKNNGPLKGIKSNALFTSSRKSRKEYLYGLFSDNPELAEKFKNDTNFDIKTIRHYISSYNADKSVRPANKQIGR